ncbi:proepiregulin [Anolis carolinensis]
MGPTSATVLPAHRPPPSGGDAINPGERRLGRETGEDALSGSSSLSASDGTGLLPLLTMAGWISPRLEGACLFLGLQLLQSVLSTTVIPICGVNGTNCTTAWVRTEKSPRVAQVRITGCKSDMNNYCFNGDCMYLVELNEHSCRCYTGYVGVRCGHSNFELVQRPLSNEYLALTILLVLLFFIAISVVIYYFYTWYQNKKRRLATNRNYEEVATNTEKDNKLLHV